jgi:hypothetical protein
MKSVFVFIIVVLFFASCEKSNDSGDSFNTESVSMGANSVEDVYYSLENGVISSTNHSEWDIAFSVPLQTATVLINEGAGVELFCVGDTNFWSSVDEYTIDSKEPRLNSKSDWYTGAFNINASGYPNYGWGTYHAGSPDHNVGGDSIYVLKLSDGSYKKFMIRVKMGQGSINLIRWANINGTGEQTVAVSTTAYFEKKNFIHFSLVNNEIKEIEPDYDQWDLLFTRYLVRVPTGSSTYVNYPVTGVLGNPEHINLAKVTGMKAETATEADIIGGYGADADIIGYDWKETDPITHQMSLVDSVSYFVKNTTGKKYHLYFTEYSGLTDGTITFKIKSID